MSEKLHLHARVLFSFNPRFHIFFLLMTMIKKLRLLIFMFCMYKTQPNRILFIKKLQEYLRKRNFCKKKIIPKKTCEKNVDHCVIFYHKNQLS